MEAAMLTKADMIEQMVKVHGDHMTKKMAGEILDNVFNLMTKSIKKDKKFSYPGFGTFVVRTRKARKGRNPQTGQEILLEARKVLTFKPSLVLKNLLNDEETPTGGNSLSETGRLE